MRLPAGHPLSVLPRRKPPACFHGEHCPHHTPPGRISDTIHATLIRTAASLIGRHIDKHQETK